MSDYRDFGCFDGDRGDMSLEARKIAITLKNGNPITAVEGNQYEQLLSNRDDIERSLNNDLLVLWLDEGNKVAWAECAPDSGETSLLRRQKIRRNDLGLFIALAQIVAESRTGGEEDSLGWYELTEEVEKRYLALNPRFRTETRGGLVRGGFENAMKRAVAESWIKKVDDRRVLILPIVTSLLDRGLIVDAINSCTSDEAYGTEGDGSNE